MQNLARLCNVASPSTRPHVPTLFFIYLIEEERMLIPIIRIETAILLVEVCNPRFATNLAESSSCSYM
jgi:hypothetical protein